MKPIILALAVSILTGCATSDITKSIQWKRVSIEDVQKICNSYALHNTQKLYGCALYSKNITVHTCTIYTSDAVEKFSTREQWILGHEVMHCFEGQYHK